MATTEPTMPKRTGRIVGALFLLSNATFLIGALVLIEPTIGASNYLTLVATQRMPIVLGVLLELVNGLAYLGIALLIFPTMKQRFERLALGYFGFRLIEFVMQLASGRSALSLVTLSEAYVAAGSPEAAFQSAGAVLLAERYWAFQMVSITFGLGALLLYFMFYQTRLIPRFISIWGLAGAVLVLANTVVAMLGFEPGLLSSVGVVMLANELFLGV